MTQRRSTWQKTAVKEALNKSVGFVSAQELYQSLVQEVQKIGLTTIYRALTDLVQVGEADSLALADGETKYRNCGTDHHHHLICRACGKKYSQCHRGGTSLPAVWRASSRSSSALWPRKGAALMSS